MNINPAYRTPELEYALNKAASKGLVTASMFKSSHYLAMLAELAPELKSAKPRWLSSGRLPHLRTVIRLGEEETPGCYNFAAVLTMGGAAERRRLEELSTLLHLDDAINISSPAAPPGLPRERP